MRKKIPLIIASFFLALFLFSLISSFALAEDRKLEIDYPAIFGLKPETVKTFLPEYAKYIFNFSIAIFGLVVFGALVWGGFLYLTSAGNPAKLSDAREQISSAFLGIVILLFSYLILTTINPQLVMFKVPLLTKPEICQNNDKCPPGFECKEKKCVMKKCENDKGCPDGFSCDEEAKVCVFKQNITLISREIPLGQMIENGIWKKELTASTTALVDEFEKFLNEEISVNPKFNRISDLNRYLRNLTENCRCNNLDALVTKPADWGSPVECKGDPCRDKRKEIDKIRTINSEKIKKLSEKDKGYKDRISAQHASSTAAGKDFLNAYKEMTNCLESGGDLTTLNEYLALVEFYTEMGWKTILIPNYLPSQADPLTFYCSKGGTIFDMPNTPPIDISNTFDESISISGLEAEIEVHEPLSCLGEIPVGKILDEVVLLAAQSNSYLGLLTTYIDELTKELRDMEKFISRCNDQSCEVDSNCMPRNPCYLDCAPPPVGCGWPACASPCLNATGGCISKYPDTPPFRGSACPRDNIEASLKKIEIYEEDMLKIIADIKEFSSSADEVLKDKEDNPVILDDIRAMTSFCFSKDVEEPTWMMLNCEIALGNMGPNGEEITNCHPQSFFCCTADKKEFAKAKVRTILPESAFQRDPSYGFSPTTDSVPPSGYGYNNIPYFSQSNPKWGSNPLLGKKSKRGKCTIKSAGCRITSIAMVLKYSGDNTDPGQLNKWAQEKRAFSGCSAHDINVYANPRGLKLARTFKNDEKNQIIEQLRENPRYPIISGGRLDAPYFSDQHWVVLTGADKEYVYVNDPAFSRRGVYCKPPGICRYPINIFKRGTIIRAELLVPKEPPKRKEPPKGFDPGIGI